MLIKESTVQRPRLIQTVCFGEGRLEELDRGDGREKIWGGEGTGNGGEEDGNKAQKNVACAHDFDFCC